MIDYDDLCKWRTIIDDKVKRGDTDKAHLIIKYCFWCDGFQKPCAAYITDRTMRKVIKKRNKKAMQKAHGLEKKI